MNALKRTRKACVRAPRATSPRPIAGSICYRAADGCNSAARFLPFLRGFAFLVEDALQLRLHRLVIAPQQFEKELGLAAKVRIERTTRIAGRVGNIFDTRRHKALLHENGLRSVEQDAGASGPCFVRV